MKLIKKYINESLDLIYSREELKRVTKLVCTAVLGVSEMDILLERDKTLSVHERNSLEEVLKRLRGGEPLQYVLGKTFFYGSIFEVSPAVLIPRPETEELVDLILLDNQGDFKMLDVGTGSGCIAISVAKNRPGAMVEAWDISEETLCVAESNNKRLGTDVVFYNRDALKEEKTVESSPKYDVIVSNPPYIPLLEKSEMEKNVLDWEPEGALFVPNEDPLLFYKAIGRLGTKVLKSGGRLYFEINQSFGKETVSVLDEMGYKDVILRKDLYGNDRIVKAKWL